MTEKLTDELMQDEYGRYTEKELKENWIDTNQLEKIMIQLSRQALHQADLIYNLTKKCKRLEKYETIEENMKKLRG